MRGISELLTTNLPQKSKRRSISNVLGAGGGLSVCKGGPGFPQGPGKGTRARLEAVPGRKIIPSRARGLQAGQVTLLPYDQRPGLMVRQAHHSD